MTSDRRLLLAAVLLGFVVGATLLSFWVATQNFANADPKKKPRTAEVLAMANIEGDESRVMFARYFASESNRSMFVAVALLQVVGGAGAFLFANRALRGRRFEKAARALLVACFALSVALAPIVPTMIRKGRAIDFTSRVGGGPPEYHEFMAWHVAYTSGDTLLLLGAAALVPLLAAAVGSHSKEGAAARTADAATAAGIGEGP